MPPKKQQKGGDKSKSAKKAQAAADKTFGLKNKNKSSKVQKYVQQVEAQNKENAMKKKKEAENLRRENERKAAALAKAETAALFNPIIQQKVPFGVDPKSVVCAFFKQGACTKGSKCKFSHNLDADRKVAKKDLYTDAREKEKEEQAKDTMDTWDEKKLRDVILSKHGNPRTTTDIVCKYFIEAVENGKYGWFWVCPNGGDDCKYKHSLPPGFVLKTKEQRRLEKLAADSAPKITLEDFIETERHKLPKNLTPVTYETFIEWKKKRNAKKAKEAEDAQKKSKALTGRQILQSGKYQKSADGEFDEDNDDGSHGTIWDLKQFREAVSNVEESDVKDYGDGDNVVFSDDSVKEKSENGEDGKKESDGTNQKEEKSASAAAVSAGS